MQRILVLSARPARRIAHPTLLRAHSENLAITNEQLEIEVQRSLNKKVVDNLDFPGWSETLSTDSEAIVKAERSPEKSIRDLQNETILIIKNKEAAKAFPLEGSM